MRADDVPIASPCEQDWDEMRVESGGARRFCEHCSKHVHNLSAMDARQARTFLRATAGQEICVAYELEDDEIWFRDSPRRHASAPADEPRPATGAIVPLARLRRAPRPETHNLDAGKLAAAASVGVMLSACTPHDPEGIELRKVDDEGATRSSPTVVIPHRDREAEPPPKPDSEPEPDADLPCDPPETNTRVRRKGRRKIKTVGVVLGDTQRNPLG